MSTAFAKFTTWGQHEINGLESLDLVRKIWHTGEEEGYWSEFVVTCLINPIKITHNCWIGAVNLRLMLPMLQPLTQSQSPCTALRMMSY
jgi:hypothetical protein